MWLIQSLSIKTISLHVFSNNLLAGLLHREVGFRTTRINRLIRKETGNEISFSVDTQSSPAPGDVGYSRMEITAHELIRQHDWLKSIYG